MRNRTTTVSIALAAVVIIAGGAYLILHPKNTLSPSDTPIVLGIVNEFGTKLQQVPLSGGTDTAVQAMEKNYKTYVAPELLSRWENDPSQAPGRLTSSPWPARIDIISAERNSDGSYLIHGSVAEITSKELTEGGVANAYPISLKVENRYGKWLITDVTQQRGQ